MANILLSIPMWFLNGCLFSLYWLGGHIPDLLSLLFGLAIAFLFDPPSRTGPQGNPDDTNGGPSRQLLHRPHISP